MGHNVGWLTLGAGVARRSECDLIEIPYDVEVVAGRFAPLPGPVKVSVSWR